MATHWQLLMRMKRPNGKNGICYVYLAGFGLVLKGYCAPNATNPPRVENVLIPLKIKTEVMESMLISELRVNPIASLHLSSRLLTG